MLNVRCLKHFTVVFIAVLPSCEALAQGQKPFDSAKIRDYVRGFVGPTSTANPPLLPLWAPTFRQQVDRCWKKPDGGSELPDVQAEFTIRLNSDGTLNGPPIPSVFNGPMTSYYQAYQESAQRALIECQPYQLPVDQFDQWKKFNPVFSNAKSSAQRPVSPDTPR
ncbi:cell envelope integrity protein TolA [Bradyrhizobium erythrophlei]|jgi:hypothetical protein|uniref:cell envelope integrity protein TolA n=1 Tax=Bradyrhizobium erythrophlei TaxID=1437360 RepID=UPI0012EBD678|nr:cell envelope integrity protein TolA [Bradyrhizobium erythrophlei]